MKLNFWYNYYNQLKVQLVKLFEKLKSNILSLYDGGKKTLKNIGEKEAKRSIKNTQKQHRRALNGAYKIFLVPESLKNDINGYVD